MQTLELTDAGLYRARYEREHRARLAAEALAERGLRELYDHQRLLELLGVIAIKANQSTSVEEALAFAIERICLAIGWKLGHAFLVVEDPPRLEPTSLWYGAESTPLRSFREETSHLGFGCGEGLPGLVLETAEPCWIPNIPASENFLRAASAQRCNLTAAFAFPVLAGTRVVAVLEFFLDHPRDPDAPLLRIMGQIGAQLGRVAERKAAEDKLIYDSSHDTLTHLPKRDLLLDQVNRAIARHARDPEARFAVLYVDLDRFKVVNDSLGHGWGDELILLAAGRFTRVLRESDTIFSSFAPAHADTRSTLGRVGGDEFIILLEGLEETSDAARVALRLQQALVDAFEIRHSRVFITASIGIASSDSGYKRAGDVVRDADLAMYNAKSSGRAQYSIFDNRMHAHAVRRLELECSLRLALARQELLLYYMPIVSLATGVISGFEALLRWNRPSEGIVAPGEFIGIAEDTGLIIPIGEWVLEEACRTLCFWRQNVPGCADLTININLSPRQFAHPELAASVSRILAQTAVDPAAVKLEITESCAMGDSGRAIHVMRQLRDLGVELALDDFGTGFSSLSYLHRFPLQSLKIDRSFVSRMTDDPESLAIVRTIVSLARDLRLDVTAEGPETGQHSAALRHLGVDFAQGYFFSPPVPVAAATAMLRAEHPAAAA